MKVKKLSKVLATLLAVVMIFTTLPLMAFAEEPETFNVSYGSPAILMNEMTKVDLNNAIVEISKGTTVSGSLITWSAEEQAGFSLQPNSKTIMALTTGTFKLKATYGALSKTIYVFAKSADETDFYLVDYDFTVDKFVPSEWNLVYYAKDGGGNVGEAKCTDGTNPAYFNDNSGKTGGYVYVGPNNGAETNASGGKLWVNHGLLVNNNPIFKDFADYTIISTSLSRNNVTNDWTGIGPAARIKLTDDGVLSTDQNSILSFIMRNSTVRIQSHMGSWWADGVKTYEGSLVNKESVNEADKFLWYDKSTYHTTTGVFSGDNVQLYFDNTKLFDLSAATDDVKTKWSQNANYAISAGQPGVWAYGGGARVRTFTVKLNSNELAPATAVEMFKVSYAAPAIPMNENTGVDLSLVNVEMDAEGTLALGSEITWSAKKQNGLYLNAEGKKVSVYTAGQYKLTATYKGVSKNIWIIAKKADETDFYLANFPEFNSKTYNGSDWLFFDTKTGAVHSDVASTADTYIKSPSKCLMVYNSEILKDFADYTVEASMQADVSDQVTANPNRGAGIAGRVQLDKTGAWNFNGVVSYILQNKLVNIRTPQASNSNSQIGTSIDVSTDITLKAWYGNTYHTLKNIYTGSKVMFYYDGTLLADSSQYSGYTCANQIAAGTIGFVGYEGNALIKSFSVKLNSNAMPETVGVEYAAQQYAVKAKSPAIPMNAFTVLSTSEIAVEIDGELIDGEELTFTLAENTPNVTIGGGKITAYSKGTYKLNVAYGEKTATVYLVVKNPEDTEFVIYGETFGDYTGITTFPNNWKSQWRQDGNSGAFTRYTWGDFESPRIYEASGNFHQGTTSPGIVPFSNTRSWNSAGYFTLNDEVVSAFSDYTIIATMAAYAHHNDAACGVGIFGRANTTSVGKLDNLSTLTGVYAASHSSKKLAQKIESAPGADAATATITRTTIGENWDYTNRNSRTESVTMVVKFAGENILTYMNGDDQSFTATTANTNNGTVGIYAGMIGDRDVSSEVNIREFKVILNNEADDMPDADEIKMNKIKYYDPVISMYNGTEIRLNTTTVQLKKDGADYLASDIEWQLPDNNGIEMKGDSLIAYKNGIYTLTATIEGISKKIYVFVVDKGQDEIRLFSEDFAEKTLDYSVWQQTEYYWGVPYQVTAQKEYKDKYIEGNNIAQVGAIPFVTKDYWDALTLGGPRSNANAGGTGYDWNKIFMNNAHYYAYIREDYVTKDGVKLSDLGVYTVTMAGEAINPGTNISEYNASKDTYGGIRMEYNGIGIMGRVNFAGESYFKKGTSSMHSFIWDGPVKISAGSSKAEANTSNNLTTSFGAFSLKAEYRDGKVYGRYIPIGNKQGYFNVPSYSTEVTADNQTGSIGFYTEARDILIYDFTVTYPINVIDYVDYNITTNDNTVTVPVNTTVDLSKYSFTIGGKTVKGNEVAWSGVRNSVGELDTYNKTFTGFTAGTVTVNDVKFVVSETEAIAGAITLANVNGNGSITVSPNASTNSYTAKVIANAGQLLKAGVITVAYEDGTVKTVPVDANGNAEFTTDHIGGISISATIIEKKELGFVSIGATIRVAKAGTTAGIKFGARANNIRLNGGKAILDSEVTINGVDYKVAEIGSIIIPTKLIEDTELTVNTKYVKKTKATVVSNASENFADITAVLTDIPEIWYGLDISFRGYIKYTNLDGTGEYYVYTNEVERSYNSVFKAAPVSETGIGFNVDNTSIILKASKANIKYGLGEQMIVFADTYINGTMANGIKLSYKVYAGNADGYSGSALATGTVYSAADSSAKISYVPENAGYYYMVVSALDSNNNIVITDTIRLGSGIKSAGATSEFDEDNIALSFGSNSDTHIYGEYMNSGNNRNLRDVLKILNNQAGYYSDGTQKLDAFLIAGDLTNATAGGSNFSGLPGWATATTKNEFQYLIYAEWDAMRNIINDGLGDAQFIYSLGNHDSQGSARGGYTNVNFAIRTTNFYQQILSGKRVDIVPSVGMGMGSSYDKSVLFDAMTEEAIADLQYNPNDDYTDSKDYIRHYGRDETSGSMFALGNRKMTINGYTFIVLENTTLQNSFARYTDATLRFLKESLDESVRRDPSAPVFIITHHRPYGTLGDGMDVVGTGSVNIQEVLKDYPQAFIWGGHVHDSLQSETSIYQTRTVDENGNVIDHGYTSLTCGATTSDTAGTHGSSDKGGFTQLVQVDVNGNVRITKYTVGASADSTDCEVDDNVNEITMNNQGQWVKAYEGNQSPAILTLQTINNPWYVVNSVDDNVRDEYTHDVRAAQFEIGFEPGSATLNGKKLTFKKAINRLGFTNENTTVTYYYAFLFDANSNNIETQILSTNIAGYAKYTDMPDTYTINFNNKGAFVIIRAYDFWVAYLGTEHQRYISNDAQIAVNQSQA